jgi:hypothetical protein
MKYQLWLHTVFNWFTGKSGVERPERGKELASTTKHRMNFPGKPRDRELLYEVFALRNVKRSP